MIFKTIDDNDSLSGQRIVSKFTARKIAQEEATKQLEIDIQCLRNYEAECQKGSVSTETFSNTMKGASIEAQKYAVNIKEGTGSVQTFSINQRTIQASMSETSIVSRVAAAGLSIFKATLNSFIFFAAIEGIQLLIKGINNLILTADEAEEKAETLNGNMQSFFNEVQSGQQTISSVSDRFAELSEHVTKTGENIDLTKDEYSEYLNICNQVKTIMPELVSGYTNEGNAIIKLKNNVDSLTESYKKNIRTKAAAFVTNGDDDGNTIQSFFDDYKIFTEGENGLFAPIGPSAGGLWYNKSTDYEDYYGYDKVHEWLEDVADLSLKDLQNLRKGTTQATYLYALLKENGYELANITEDNYEAVHDVLDTRLTSLEGEMATRVSNVKMSLQQMLYADRDYWDIDDKEALSAIDSMFSSIDSEFIKQNNLLGQDALQSFESNVIKLFEDKDTQRAMIDIYTPQGDDESIEDYSKRVNDAIEEVQNYAKDKKIDIPLDFTDTTENIEDLQESYENTINRFNDSDKIKDFFDTEGINTQDELDKFNEVADSITDADLAIQRWNEHKKEFGEASDLSEFLSENKKLEKQLIQLSKVGKLDTETIQSLDDYDKLLSLCGNDADKLITKLKKLSDESNTTFDATNNLDTITGGLDSLSEVYSQAMNDGFVDSDALASLYDQFGDLSVFEDFAKAMQNIGEAGYDSAQSFNDLADAYINAKLPLSDLTEATKKQYIAELEKNGVENAEEAITGRLNYITTVRKNAIESLANTQEYANTTTEDLANATFEEITQMINAAEASGADTKALGLLAAAKIQSNANQLNESTTIEQLIDAAQAAGVGTVAIDSYNHTKNYLHGQDLENYTKSFKERLLKELNDIKIDFPKYKYNGVSPKTKSDSGKSASDSAKEAQDTSKQYDWIAIAIQRCEEAITSLDRAEGNTYEWWSKRNKALLEEINQTAREIELLQYSYNGYMDAANAVGLSDDYKQKVINGTIQIETVSDENLQKKIDEFQQWWEKARDCKDKIDELNISLSKLAQQKFDNIVSHFEEREKAFTGLNDILDAQVKLAEAKGQIVSRKYYDAMVKNEQSNNKLLVQQRDQMVKSLNEAVSLGKIKQGSEAWYDMKAQIDAINKAIIESNTSLQEFQNSIRQLEWDKFDRLIEEIQDVADEIDWVSSLLKDDDLTDGKSNRGLTDKGNAKMGSYASMYNLYMAESQKYASEIKKIDKELAKDPYNQDLIDRKKELIKAQRDAISSAEDEKDAMIDLARKGYDAILESLQDLIDKKKEALKSEKDLYEYQKSIAEKTKNIATLKKQLITYDKDNSEEAKKKVQQIRVDLADAEQDLRDTEYDRWVSDQEEMMDNLYQDYSDKIDEKFENLEVLFQDLLKNVNDNSASISNTLKEVAKDAGYIVSDAFDTIFSGGKIASNFNGKFTTYQTTVQNALAEIVNSVTNMYEIAAKQAGVKVKQTEKAKGSADDKKEDKKQNTVNEKLKWEAGKGTYDIVKSTSIQTSDGSILTPVSTAQLNLTRGIDASLANISKSPILNMSNVSSNGSAGDVQLVIENIALPNVKDPKEFSEQLLSAMQNDKQVLKTMRAATIDLAVGKNSKRINRF